MVLTKEYRICMPLTVEEYQIGQLYMIARHSHEQTDSGEGVEVVENVACEDPEYGQGQYTEKRIHLSSRLPYWIQSFIPKVFYVTEKAWNYYPFTITEYTCSFIPKFSISIKTKYENNNGSTDNCLNLDTDALNERTVEFVDIAYDEVNPKHYKEEESIREILLLGHRQAFAWIDEWYGMTLEDVRMYEEQMQRETNTKVAGNGRSDVATTKGTARRSPNEAVDAGSSSTPAAHTPTTPSTPCTPKSKSWFSWS
ncbi:cytoplasmic phosphatidylinositol transfer protein 1 isoform X3 [Cryptotermes secundus]|uniref:cytoplasmic phosphatidylinositol transfer protein 1 isoform X3 n=1 Tax=Cryptotermes secundus TaxID=105785 RepID=UPI001454CD70|nr:cytoplasmic phosphatidylinositol transfer protein 1 isoform X3 [Cryptotermes secundus]